VVFVTDQTRPAPFPVRSAVAAVVAGQAAQVKAARFAAEEAGVPFDPALARARALANGQARVEVEAVTVGGRTDALPTGFNFGETLGRFAVALLQGLIIFVVGLGVFGVDWGDPPAALLLLVTIALIARDAGLAGITRQLAVLAAFAAALLALAVWRLRRTLIG
jgi:hypothetical protein